MFSVHTTADREKFEKAINTNHFHFAFGENLGREITGLSGEIRFFEIKS